ncbi:MAG TPA: hypothetical protein VGM90_20780 [Kofleriaceae bacterium]
MRIARVAVIRPYEEAIAVPSVFERYAQIDRASFEHAPIDPPAALVSFAEKVTERELRPVSARVIRQRPGDYLLAHYDELHDDHRVEVVVDVSPAIVEGAEVRYRRNGAVFFIVPSQPGTASVVERGPTTQAYHTYISKLREGALVQRLVMQLVDR